MPYVRLVGLEHDLEGFLRNKMLLEVKSEDKHPRNRQIDEVLGANQADQILD